MSHMTEFALDGDLPTGATVLEASAGTGKTFAIAALAARFIAEAGMRISDLMIVTFSRNATAELRTRVFERLGATRAALAAYRSTGQAPADPVDALLCAPGPGPHLDERIARLDGAITEFDDATIRTTHEFCRTMLGELGVLADHDPSAHLADDIADIVDDAISDTFITMFAAQDRTPISFTSATTIGRAAAHKFPTVDLDEADIKHHGVALDFARRVRARVEFAKRSRGLYTFDDMVTRLKDALNDPVTGPQAASLLARRFPVVLIDEFQDTDPAQWDVVRHAFVGRSTVVLIGDPKQSIYAFRNADVAAYLDAVGDVNRVHTLTTNYRSDRPLVEAVNALFGGAALGDSRIVVHPVKAHHPARIHPPTPGSGMAAPLRVRAVAHDRQVWWRSCERLVVADTAVQVVDLLSAGMVIDDADGQRPLRARDVAVLVQANEVGKAIYAELARLGQAAVLTGADSVFGSDAADDWRVLLAALSEPRHNLNARAALTSLLGWTAHDLASASGEARDELTLTMARLTRLIAASGVAAVFAWLQGHTTLYERLLATPHGERTLTDLRQIAEELDAAQRTRRLSPSALLSWLDDRIKLAHQKSDGSAQRRIETDRDAVQIMTIHRAKGLAFGYVFLPDIGRGPYVTTTQPFVRHEAGRRVLNLGVGVQPESEASIAHRADEAAETLRKLYVGVTRGRFGATLWWFNTPESPLQRLFYAHQGPGVNPGPSFAGALVPPAGLSFDPSLIRFERVDPDVTPRPCTPTPAKRTLAAQGWPPEYRPFHRVIDQAWIRTSYSGLTANAHELVSMVGTHEPDEADEPNEAEPADVTDNPPGQSSLIGLPGGTLFGSLVHAALEQVDPASGNLRQDMADAVARLLPRLPVPGLDAEPLINGLVQVVRTPLGLLTGGGSLADLGAANRLAELEFEMPLSLASPAAWRPRVADLAQLWDDPRTVPADDPLRGYGPHLAASEVADTVLAGFLTGSIDVVLRAGEADRLRYVVLDYKTNRIPVPPGEELGSHHYTQAAMAQAMIASHYPLQALLYSVALHRMLALRQPGYSPRRHLGGVGYLFVRGMCGPDTPTHDGVPQGVFTWLPTPELVVAASDILGGREEQR